MKIFLRDKRANIFMEYAMLVGVISIVFVAMNAYIKRGIQGKLKDTTDYFIGTEQAQESDFADTHSKNITGLTYESESRQRGDSGGGTDVNVSDKGGWNIQAETISPQDPTAGSAFMDADTGIFPPTEDPDDSAEEDKLNKEMAAKARQEDIKAHQDSISSITANRNEKLEQAAQKRQQAQALEQKATEDAAEIKRLRASLLNPHLNNQERREIKAQIAVLSQEIYANRKEASKLKSEASKLDRDAGVYQAEINALQGELDDLNEEQADETA